MIKKHLSWIGKGLLSMLLVPVLNFGSSALAAEVNGQAQAYICKSGRNATFQPITSHDKRFQLGKRLGRIAVLVDDGSNLGGSSGFNLPLAHLPFRFINWFYNDGNSKSLKFVTVRYCFSTADGKSLGTTDVKGGSFNRGGPVGDGWSETLQDNRVFPAEVQAGNGFLDRICFIFDGNGTPANIKIGDVEFNGRFGTTIINSLNLGQVGGCDLKEKCNAP